MSRPGKAGSGRRRSWSASVRVAVAHSRATRLRAIERRLGSRLAYLRRHGRAEFRALVALLRRVVARAARKGR